MNKTPFLLIILWLIGLNTHAQNGAKATQWDFQLGHENTRLLDRQNSPLIYVAHSAVIGTDFLRIKPQSVWGLSFSSAIGNSQAKRFGQRSVEFEDPNDIYGEHETYTVLGNPGLSYVQASLGYSYQSKVAIGTQGFLLGCQLENEFFMSGIGLDTWFFNNLSLSPIVSTAFELSDGSRIPVSLSFPLVSYVVREPFGKDPSIPLNNYIEANIETGASFATLNKFQKIDFTIGYRRNWTSKWDIGLDYTFYWYQYNEPNELNSYSNRVTIVLSKIN